MRKKFKEIIEQVTIEKLVHGGQGLATLSDGRKVFVWNALPSEVVEVRITRSKKDYAEGIAEKVIKPSAERIDPPEPDSYLATSPWQIMSFEAENKYKQQILKDIFEREKINCAEIPFIAGDAPFGYRNKMEWGFWGDEDGIHLAHFVRGSHGKVSVQGSVLCSDNINGAAEKLIKSLNELKGVRAGDIKSVIIRASQSGKVAIALFVKRKDFFKIDWKHKEIGLVVYYSNPKSPASLPTEELYSFGDIKLTDKVIDTNITYDVLSFFQVNLPVFEMALKRIDYASGGMPKIDMYSGVGTIGIPIGMTEALIESDERNVEMAKNNTRSLPIKVIHATSETALDYIAADKSIIVDPPRAGLHKNVVERLLDVKPPQIIYLSCNPATQARDVALLGETYKIRILEGYNFFPRTPHIESLVVLELK